jgi:hypothetical protein
MRKYLVNYVKQEIMKTEIFKVGDKVFHLQYGWGEVESDIFDNGINEQIYRVHVRFLKNNTSFTFNGKEFKEDEHSTLSFTEYTLQGFTQERPVVLPEVGELCLVRDKDNHSWTAKKFAGYIPNAEFPYVTEDDVSYTQMKRIKILD